MAPVRPSETGHLPSRDAWAFDALKELLVKEKGFDLESYKERCILRRIYLKMRSSGHTDLGTYYRKLRRDADELTRLFQYLTINVTEFFRNPAAFEYLEKRILPDLLIRQGLQGNFSAWSAGCSTGEEPYSLAITVFRAARTLGLDIPFTVHATDVDKAVLEHGRKGLYAREALKNVREEDLREFFLEEEGGVRVSGDLRRKVVFRAANVLESRPPGKQSLVVCRNLLIYFSRENQERVISGFSRALHNGGYLMLGKAETLVGKNRLFFQSISPTERIYRLRDMPLSDGGLSAAT